MAKDDYFVIVYKILSYLYKCLKNDDEVDVEVFKPNSKLFIIKENYFNFILKSIIDNGLIVGADYVTNVNGECLFSFYEDLSITVKGIQYLEENTVIEKAKLFLKDIKDLTPFI